MKRPTLNLSTRSYTDDGFLGTSRFVLASLTSPSFPNPIPPLANLSDAIDAFNDSITGARGGSHADVAIKNARRSDLEAVYVQLGLYVMFIANGDAELLRQSGYPVGKEREPIYITNPGNVTLVNGVTSGELESSVDAVKGSKLYLHQITDNAPDENTVWDTRTCSRCKYTFKGLIAGKKYWVRVAATASGDQIAYSTVASQFVI